MIKYIKYPPAKRGKIILWGLLASYPFGGMTWQVLHHLAGLRQLGFDVWYVEDSDRLVLSPNTYSPTYDYFENVKFLSKQMESIGLGNRWIFRPPTLYDKCLGARDINGLSQLYKEADAVLNLCGSQELKPEHSVIRTLVYLETDPIASQIKVANGDEETIKLLSAYDFLFTYGENLGSDDCLIPAEKFLWHKTRPPVIVGWWEGEKITLVRQVLTTVANLKQSAPDVSWQGKKLRWSKHDEFQLFLDLPCSSKLPLEIAVGGISESEISQLQEKGWKVVPAVSIADPLKYMDYIRSSLGEFTVSKEQYVHSRSGWFSDRSVCYLASGRPVITQETGFSRFIPMGKGLFSFNTLDDAIEAIDSVSQNYEHNSDSARDLAHEYFSAEKVLADVMTTVGLM